MLKITFLMAILTLTAAAVWAQGSSKKPDTSAPTKVTGDGTKLPMACSTGTSKSAPARPRSPTRRSKSTTRDG